MALLERSGHVSSGCYTLVVKPCIFFFSSHGFKFVLGLLISSNILVSQRDAF